MMEENEESLCIHVQSVKNPPLSTYPMPWPSIKPRLQSEHIPTQPAMHQKSSYSAAHKSSLKNVYLQTRQTTRPTLIRLQLGIPSSSPYAWVLELPYHGHLRQAHRGGTGGIARCHMVVELSQEGLPTTAKCTTYYKA